MNYELNIALRYLLSRKSHGAVNVISAVAIAGVAVAAAAMIVVLSVFNGFAGLVDSKVSNFNPPYMVNLLDGRIIINADSLAGSLGGSPILDEQAFVIGGIDGQMPISFRAMTPEALAASGLGKVLVDGSLPQFHDDKEGETTDALVSAGVAMGLNLRAGDTIQVFVPRRVGRVNPANPTNAFRERRFRVAAIYQIGQDEQDRDKIVIPLSAGRQLLSYTTEGTGVAVYGESVPTTLQPDLQVLDRRGQEAEAYRMIAVEKWVTFLMLIFILVIASFNIVSTLSLMVVEKQENMGVLRAMGATPGFVSRIFANQGWMITLLGGCIGLIIGSLLSLGQQHYGWVKLATGNKGVLAIDHYPVALEGGDLLLCFGVLVLVAGVIALIGAGTSSLRSDHN